MYSFFSPSCQSVFYYHFSRLLHLYPPIALCLVFQLQAHGERHLPILSVQWSIMESRTVTLRCHNNTNNKQGNISSSTGLHRARDSNREMYYVKQEYCFSIMFSCTKSKHVFSVSNGFWFKLWGKKKCVSLRIQDICCLQCG